jgi:hypothetical protein
MFLHEQLSLALVKQAVKMGERRETFRENPLLTTEQSRAADSTGARSVLQ